MIVPTDNSLNGVPMRPLTPEQQEAERIRKNRALERDRVSSDFEIERKLKRD
jgi:hypothetical protein